MLVLNTFQPTQNYCHITDIFKFIFSYENCCIWIEISLKYYTSGPINNKSELVSDNCLASDKPLSEQMMGLLMHICLAASMG